MHKTQKRRGSPKIKGKGLKDKATAVLGHDHVMRDFVDVFHEMRVTDSDRDPNSRRVSWKGAAHA